MQKSGCVACHAVDKKVIGPGYKEVAAKYKADQRFLAACPPRVKNEPQTNAYDPAAEACRDVSSLLADSQFLVPQIHDEQSHLQRLVAESASLSTEHARKVKVIYSPMLLLLAISFKFGKTKLNKRQKELLQELDALSKVDNQPLLRSLLGKMKDMFG